MRIKAKNTIRHNGVEYVEGNVFDVDTKSGERLLELGSAVTTGESPKGGEKVDRLNPMAEPAPTPSASESASTAKK